MIGQRAVWLPVLLAGLCTPLFAQPMQGERPPTMVEVAQVHKGEVRETIQVTGSLRADESIQVRPEVAGIIREVHFSEGEPVEADALLFTLDQALIAADLREIEASFKLSERDFARAEDLLKRRLGAQSDYDSARARLEADRARLESMRTRMAKTEIRAPFAGVAGLRNVSPGEYVQIGQALVNLVALDPIKVDFRVPELFLSELAVGQPIRLTVDALQGEVFTGEVYAIDPQVDTSGRSIALRARLANPERKLRPGLFARVDLATTTRADALLVPEQALWPMGDKVFVYRVVDGKALLSEVTTGKRRSGEVEISEGLDAGDVVVTAGQMKLSEGAPVQPLGEQPDPGAAAAAQE